MANLAAGHAFAGRDGGQFAHAQPGVEWHSLLVCSDRPSRVRSYNYLSPSFMSVRPPLTPVAVLSANHHFIILAATLTEAKSRTLQPWK